MAAKFGHCFRELGQGDKAEYFARRSLDMVDGYVRGRTFNVVLLANAQLQQQDLDAACATGNQALDLGSGLQSARTIKYIRDSPAPNEQIQERIRGIRLPGASARTTPGQRPSRF